MSLSSSSSICTRSHQMLPSAVKRTCRILISCAPVFPAAMPSFGGELATTIPDARLSIRSFLVNIIPPIRLVRRTAYFPRWYNGVLRCNAICTGPPPAVRGPARASAPALRFLGVSDRGPAFNRKVRTKSLCKCPVRLWLPCVRKVAAGETPPQKRQRAIAPYYTSKVMKLAFILKHRAS